MTGHLLVVGAQRCGTTYLHALLDAHPEITMARPARPEPKVFCSDEVTHRGVEWYHDTYFGHAGAERLLGEKSTSYLEDADAPGRAAEVLRDAHIVVLLRDPVARAVSNWRFSSSHGMETRPLQVALRDSLVAEAPWDRGLTSVSPFAYLTRGRYVEYLEPWTAAFPATTHVLFLEELVEEHRGLDGLWSALGVDPSLAPRRPDRALNRSDGEAPALDADLSGMLGAYFEDSRRALAARLGRELPW